jgi:hypothetical protein
MTSGMTAFAIAVGGTSLACYVLTNGGHVSDGGGMPFGWSGGDHSVSDSSDDPADGGADAGDGGGN